ncbi:MAG: redoxin domain-containing protein [Methanomassiliicoccales archaeon]|jgi:peroxiredoxin
MEDPTLPEVGDPAPDFTLPEASEEAVRFRGLLGKGSVVLIFYPADWGWVCNSEMKEFSAIEHEFNAMGASLVAIGTNSTISHRGWKEMLKFSFPLLSDFDGAVTRLYGVLDTTDGFNKGRSVRAVFVVDAGGVVRYKWVAETPWIEPDYQEVLKATVGLQ